MMSTHTHRLAIATLAAALLAVAPAARAELVTTIPALSLDTSLGAVHFPARLDGAPRFNDFTPGLGLEWPVTTTLTAMTGVYRNSYRRTAFYIGGAWTPWAWRVGPLTVRPGLLAGLVSGYTRGDDPVAPLFAAGLLQLRAGSGIGLNLIGLPRMDGQAGFVGAQLVTPLP